MLKLVGEIELIPCPKCEALGRIPQPPTLSVRTGMAPVNVPGTGSPIPCPRCLGRRVVTRG